MKQRTSITGRGWAFPFFLTDRNQIALVEDDEDIRQAIYIILFTAPGERVMRPDFGCAIHDMVFSPANDETAAVIERMVTEALTRWEPRVNLRQVIASPGRGNDGEILIDIEYEIKATHDIHSMVYPFYLTPA
jgi:hypothetical protein